MSNKSTKQLMQDLESAIKDLKNIHTDRNQMLSSLKTKQTQVEVTKSNV